MTIRYGSVCSGIEAASVAWHSLGWKPQWFSEIEAFPSAVLAHRWPDVPNLGDFTKIGGDVAAIDLLVGGTPCQSFSVAGLRGGLEDERGQLALEFLRLARRLGPRWIVWENVPGVLSSNRGRDFGSFLGGLVELGYGFAYRVLDAQYFGVPQKRRRVFVVAHLGDWRRAAAVLFERAGVARDLASTREEEARREVRQDGSDAAPPAGGEWWDGRRVSQTLDAVLYKKQALPEKNRFPAAA
jgi:DNA (cytosine-5)-methyltransferase 1